mgnify:CR=1 FL=1
MDKLRAMNTFVRIVETGSLSAAATALDSSLSAVVRSLAQLEAALGVRLLNRTTRRIALTEEGRDYLAICQRVLAELQDAETLLGARRRSPAGKLAITAPVRFGSLHVAPLLADFLHEHPAMSAELLLLDRVVDLLEEGLDLAVRIGELPDSTLVAVPLGSTPRVVCASPGYLQRHGRPVVPADLAGHRCVRFSGLAPGTEWEFAAGGRRIGVSIAGTLATNQIDAALAAQNAVAAAESLGLGTVYIGAMRNRPEDVAAELQLPPRVVAVFGLCVGAPDPAAPASVKPRPPQSVVLHQETYSLPAQEAGLETYDQAMAAFYAAQGMKVRGTWSNHSAKRIRDAASLTGRDRLAEPLRNLGFPLR